MLTDGQIEAIVTLAIAASAGQAEPIDLAMRTAPTPAAGTYAKPDAEFFNACIDAEYAKSCIVCGHVAEPKVCSIENPSIYVCVGCHSAATEPRSLKNLLLDTAWLINQHPEYKEQFLALWADKEPTPAAAQDERGAFEKAIDKLIYTAWYSGEQDGSEGVKWGEIGDSYNSMLRSRINDDKKALLALIDRAAASPVSGRGDK
jgi:hypothetical protein